MAHRTPSSASRQVASARYELVRAPALPIAELLPEDRVRAALAEEQVSFRDRLFSPLVTLWVFLSQVLDADHSCRQAVARLLAYRVARGLPPCSADTGAYCRARQRLPEGLLTRLVRRTGRQVLDDAVPAWRWQGRAVKIADGTTVSMPDTPANQAAYPQSRTQKPGVGFPIARMVVLFSLAVGTVLDAALAPYQGKQSGETALFRQLHAGLEAGDVLLADRYYCSYFEIALAQQRGADVVLRLHQRRRVNFRRGLHLGKGDHVVLWCKPTRPDWMAEATYAQLPTGLVLREVAVRVRQVGFRTRRLVLATTLTDSAAVSSTDLADLYRLRWQAELDLRSLKATLQMDVLRCQTPAMVRKEVWAHLLVYNLIRAVMARAAAEHTLSPLELSFKGALQTMHAFASYLLTASAAERTELGRELLRAVASHRVGDRPDRYEPRAVKRRPKSYSFLNEPRAQARARLATKACA